MRIDRQDVILVVSAKDQLSPGRGIQPFDAPFLKSIGINDRNHIDVAQIKAFSSHPSFFFVNSEGVVVSPAFTGAVPVFDKFMPELDKLLAEEGSA